MESVRVLTSVDEITATLLQYPDGLRARAADLLDNKFNVFRVDTGLVHVAILLDRLQLRDVIVVIVGATGTGAREVGHAATRAARELLGSRQLSLRVHVLDLSVCL